MRILHCCLSNFYIDNYNYQENMLTRQNRLDGHEVLIIASTETFVDNITYGYVQPSVYINEDGIKVVRVPYKRILTDSISHKFRAYKGVANLIKEFSPDVIVFHGIGAWELRTVVKYAKQNNVRLFVDTHASAENSGTNWVSLNILHKLFYKRILKKALPYVEKVFCIAFEEYAFAKKVYEVPESKMELWPLGGMIPENEVYQQKRLKCREELGISANKIVFLHAGKLVRGKKTCELVKAFREVQDKDFCLLIAGSLGQDIEEEALQLFATDSRINFLGWKSGADLLELLCATDVYLQPGTVSVTLQNSLCCRCAAMVYPYELYKWILEDVGYYAETNEDMQKIFENISVNRDEMLNKRKLSFERAKTILDYKIIAARLYK